MSDPVDAVAAATHDDPYPWYSARLARAPLAFSERHAMWIASSADATEAVLNSPLVRVRPIGEPVPPGLVGTPAGEVFGRLVRMNDGARQRELKQPIIDALDRFSGESVQRIARSQADRLAAMPEYRNDPTCLCFALPVSTLGEWYGIADEDHPELLSLTHAFVRGIGPAASTGEMIAASKAVPLLLRMLERAASGRISGIDRDSILANLTGFLFQSYDATAGLIGNTLLALGREGRGVEASLAAIVREVSRWDPSIQNTRRFVAEDGLIAGSQVQAGDAILVLLAAANRDPALNQNPDEFDPYRKEARSLTFGSGTHMCPGEHIALEIATAGVEALLAAGHDPSALSSSFTYLPSANARIPVFTGVEEVPT